ncbi:hypothetical protein C3L33_00490, partial [Rhododendron williamsianum]
MASSDDLYKSNAFVEGVSHKIRRQIEELERVSGVVSSSLTVDGVPVDSYLTRFVWDEAKYPTMSPLKEIVDAIHVQVSRIEDDLKFLTVVKRKVKFERVLVLELLVADSFQLRIDMSTLVILMGKVKALFKAVKARVNGAYLHVLVRVAEYNNVRSQLNAINRKQGGSLAVRDLSNLVKPQDIVTSEHLETLLAIVPKYSERDWLSSYETLTTYVVPRSSKKLYEDNEYALHTVTLFRRDADNFRNKARERGFQIREFEHNPETQDNRKQELEKLMQDQETLRSSLLQWCYASYGEVFSSWMHFCAVRLFAESILRYGLPPSFLSVVLSPSVKSEKKVRSILEELCDSRNSTFWKYEEEGGMAGLGGDADAHPYVCFTINLV